MKDELVLTHLLEKRVLLLDGAMGTMLQQRGYNVELPLWSARVLLEHPREITRIHQEYIAAGADIITTNTFRTNPGSFIQAGYSEEDAREATFLAVSLAKEAVKNSPKEVLIAGSIAPVEDCYHPELAPGFREAYEQHQILAGWLKEAGVDFLLLETFNTIQEARGAVRAAHQTGLPFIVSFIINHELNLLSGEPLPTAFQAAKQEGVSILSLNCSHPIPLKKALKKYTKDFPELICAYGNLGKSDIYSDEIAAVYTPREYLGFVRDYLALGIRIIGACCGSTPAHIRAINSLLHHH